MVISLVGDGDFLGMFIPPWKTISKSNGSHDLYVHFGSNHQIVSEFVQVDEYLKNL